MGWIIRDKARWKAGTGHRACSLAVWVGVNGAASPGGALSECVGILDEAGKSRWAGQSEQLLPLF